MVNIERFLADHRSDTLVAGSGLWQINSRLRTTLWQQWRCMDTAWCNHNSSDRNVGMETMAKLGKIVEATGRAVVQVLLVSGYILEAEHGAESPTPTTSNHKGHPTTIRHSDDAEGEAPGIVQTMTTGTSTRAIGGGQKARSSNFCDEVAVVSKRVMTDTKQGGVNLSMDNKGHVTNKEAEPERLPLAVTVGSHDLEDLEELHETKQSAPGVQRGFDCKVSESIKSGL